MGLCKPVYIGSKHTVHYFFFFVARAHEYFTDLFLLLQQVCNGDDVTKYHLYILSTFVFRRRTVMYVQVRMMDTGVSATIPTSRTTLIDAFKKLVEQKFNVKPEEQRLFFAGKQVLTPRAVCILLLLFS